jgi:hypothetical protein
MLKEIIIGGYEKDFESDSMSFSFFRLSVVED